MKKILIPLLALLTLQPATTALADANAKANDAIERVFSEQCASLSEDDRLYALFDALWDWRMEENPIHATYVGVTEFNDRWPDQSREGIQRGREQIRAFFTALQRIDPERLGKQARLDWNLVCNDLESRIEGYQFPEELMPVDQLGGPQSTIPNILRLMPRSSKKDFDNLLARLAAAPGFIRATLPMLRAGLAAGITPPQVTLAKLPGQFDALVREDPRTTPLWESFRNKPSSISTAQWEQIQSEAEQLIAGPVRDAYLELKMYLVDDYIPNCRQSISQDSLPNGKDWYAYRVRRTTTTDLSPDQIHNIGLAEVERIQAEIMEIARSAGFEGDFAALRQFLHTDPRFFCESEDDLLDGYRIICKRADPELAHLFRTLPRLPYGIVPTPAHLAASSPSGQYSGGSLESGRPGYFQANTYDLKSRPSWAMEPLALHETVPGHHLQIAIARELDHLHKVRRYLRYTAYSEGWALYSEQLGYDMGMYQDPWSQIGQKASEIFRAVRLVLDTGIHSKGWTRDQAITYFRRNSLALDHVTQVEVDRYIIWPSQALSYKIGQLEIFRMRQYAETSLGDGFDIRDFHEVVLTSGALPLNVLEQLVRDWVDRES